MEDQSVTIEVGMGEAVLKSYLFSKGLVKNEERIVGTSVPGEGNMNVVIRVQTDQQSIILKQSRPYVVKYPSIPAPKERIDVEYQFYHTLKDSTLSKHFPKVILYDQDNGILGLKDLGNVDDMTPIYSKRRMEKNQLKTLVELLSTIHESTVQKFPQNLELRKLNHQHIFILPFMVDNGFNLDEIQTGLAKLAKPFQKNDHLRQVCKQIGDVYLSDEGNTLLHGDYYPGSWMSIDNKLYVLDPEFSFKGFKEFDLGVMGAHLFMASGAVDILKDIMEYYAGRINRKLYYQMVGIEVMRRIIGIAQLPLARSLPEKKFLLDEAYKYLMI